jgi:hypothetical protein
MAFDDYDSMERDLAVLAPGGYGASQVYNADQREELIEDLLARVQRSKMPPTAKARFYKLVKRVPRQLALHELMKTRFTNKAVKGSVGTWKGGERVKPILRHLNEVGALPPVSRRPYELTPPELAVTGRSRSAPSVMPLFQGRLDEPIEDAMWRYVSQDPGQVATHEFTHGAQSIGGSNIEDLESLYNNPKSGLLRRKHPSHQLTAEELQEGEHTKRLRKPHAASRLARASSSMAGELGAQRGALTEELLDEGIKRTKIPNIIRRLQIMSPDTTLSRPMQAIDALKSGNLISEMDALHMESELKNQAGIADDVEWDALPRVEQTPEGLDKYSAKVEALAERSAGANPRTMQWREMNKGLEKILDAVDLKKLLRMLT